MLSLDLSEVPLEERMPNWVNFDGMRVWDESESLSMMVRVLKMQKHAKIIKSRDLDKLNFSGCWSLIKLRCTLNVFK